MQEEEAFVLRGRWSTNVQRARKRETRTCEHVERTEQALETRPEVIAAACPFCNTMMTDGVKNKEKRSLLWL